MAIKTRQTDGTGVTNNDAPLTNAEVDNNFIELVAVDATKLANVVEDTTPQLGGDLASNGNDVLFADNDKAIFGAGSDLEIYHDGTNNRITLNSPNTYIQTDGIVHFTDIGNSEKHLTINDNGAVDLYHNNALKLATTATGVDVTGTVTADGLTVENTDALITLSGTRGTDTSHTVTTGGTNSQNLIIATGSTSGNGLYYRSGSHNFQSQDGTASHLTIDSSGNVDITGDLAAVGIQANQDATGVLGGINLYSARADAGTRNWGFKTNYQAYGDFVIRQSDAKDGDPSGAAGTTRMTIDPDGNVGIGVTPEAWTSGIDVLQVGTKAILSAGSTNTVLGNNWYDDGANKYLSGSGALASIYSQNAGVHAWYNAPAGNADAALTFTEVMQINTSGDVSIPTGDLTIGSGQADAVILELSNTDSVSNGLQIQLSGNGKDVYFWNHENAATAFATNNIQRMTIDSSGTLLVGTSTTPAGATSANKYLAVKGSTEGVLVFGKAGVGGGAITGAAGAGTIFYTYSGSDGSESYAERMRIDSSGNLLVGHTLADVDTLVDDNAVGICLKSNGEILASSTATPMTLERENSPGDIIEFRKDGAIVGSIGAFSGNAYFGNGDTGLRPNAVTDTIYPISVTAGGASRDNAISLGDSGSRFKDLYLSGGAYLGGTGAANKLDDYEEGTFTATLTSQTGSLTMDASFVKLSYIKVGRLVTVLGNVALSSVSTPSGHLRLTGLPFVCYNGTQNSERSGFAVYGYDLSSSTTGLTGLVINGESQVRVLNFNGTTQIETATSLMKAGTALTFNFSYPAA